MLTLISFILLYILLKTCEWVTTKLEHRRFRKGELAEPIKKYELIKSEYSINQVKQLRKMPYPQYLNSEHWNILRAAVFDRDNYKCTDCGANRNEKHLEAHHVTYVNKGYENIDDIRTLCRECHEERHLIRAAYE